MTRVRPFPFEALPAASREEIATAARIRQIARSLVAPTSIAAALADLSGEHVSIEVRRVRPLDLAQIPSDAVGMAFGPADALGLSEAVLVDVGSTLASGLVARALRQRAPRVVDPSRAPLPELAGALAAVVHAAIRRAHAGVPLRVVAAGPAQALARDLAGVHHRVATAWLVVVLGADAFDARVTVPVSDLPKGELCPKSLSVESLRAMGDMRLALPLVISTCIAGRSDVGMLREGDAFVLPRTATQELAIRGGQLVGSVALVAPTAERGLTGVLTEGGMLRTGSVESFSWDASGHTSAGASPEIPNADRPMSAQSNVTLEVLEDAPVVVRVELGAVEMKAREWASLAPGDVIALGRKLGDPAVLRVSGIEVARGELVQVDGEYGVRIVTTSMSTGNAGST